MNRRNFCKTGLFTTAFLGMSKNITLGSTLAPSPYGNLIPDPEGLLSLPKGFSYKVISRLGDRMSDGFKVPGQFDGMGAFQSHENPDHTILIRNHEIGLQFLHLGPFENNAILPKSISPDLSYDSGRIGFPPFVGGTTSLVLNQKTGEVVSQFLSLTGTDRNCAGGITPDNSWITCEEPEDTITALGQHHGYCFQVRATEKMELQKPEPIKDMGRFRHEAIAVCPTSSKVYLTEDRGDGLFYRFTPVDTKDYLKGGTLEALVIKKQKTFDTRNWEDSQSMDLNSPYGCEWVEITDPESPKDDLRLQGAEKGAAVFARAEGCWCDGDKIWFVCTNGGPTEQGQLFYYDTSKEELTLFLQPEGNDLLTNGDNLTISPQGDIFICEDRAKDRGSSKLQVVSPSGENFILAENILNTSELAGACFSPNGDTLYLNIQSPGYTLAITGPWGWS